MADPGQNEPRSGERQVTRHLVDGLDATMERMRGNPLRLVCWFVLLVWFGITLLLSAVGKIDTPQRVWAVFAWGGGAIAFIETLLRLIVPRWPEPVVNPVVWGVIWIAVGFSLWYKSWETLGPIGIIGLGLVAVGWVFLWQRTGLSKSLDERVKKIRESPVRFIAIAVLIVWFGVSLLLNALKTIEDPQRGWAIFALVGAVIFFVETMVSLWYNNLTALAPAVVIGLGLTLLGLLLPKPAK
jgi:hypothetical protein